jgi:SAM-dependent methyltransferase
MRKVFDDPIEARERGERAAADIRRLHSPEACGAEIRELLLRTRSVLARRSTPGLALERVGAGALAGRTRRSPVAAARELARKTVLRLMRPYSVRQDAVNAEILASLHRLEIRSAMVQGDMLATLRRQDAALRDATMRFGDEESSMTRMLAETRAIPYMAEPVFDLMQHPVAGRVAGYARRQEPAGDAGEGRAYRDFEDIFRGPESFIRERQRVYLEIVGDREPVLDVGCGRGEFLDLLRERGLDYLGVDMDQAMVDRCHAKGHAQVERADANSYLETREDDSLGVVFSAQFIEHLSHDDMLRFFDLSFRKLRPGGLLIAETVNPHSVPAMKAFWVDRSHRAPVFPEVGLATSRISGFESAFVFHPNGNKNVETDRYQQGEYAVVATKGKHGSVAPESLVEPDPARVNLQHRRRVVT